MKGFFDDGYSGVFVYGNCFLFLNYKFNIILFEFCVVVVIEDCIEVCIVSYWCCLINFKVVFEKDKKFIC